MLRWALEGVPMAEAIDLEELARRLDGYTGADIAGFVERAKDLPYEREIASQERSRIEPADIEAALARSQPSVSSRLLARYDKFRELRL
jgi:transitional endoplasmic reticulum ATPase